MKDNVLEQINSIRTLIFENKNSEAIQRVASFLENLVGQAANEATIKQLKELTEYCMMAIQNKDFLLLADLLWFEVPSIIDKEN